jgi:hypothetical protein
LTGQAHTSSSKDHWAPKVRVQQLSGVHHFCKIKACCLYSTRNLSLNLDLIVNSLSLR